MYRGTLKAPATRPSVSFNSASNVVPTLSAAPMRVTRIRANSFDQIVLNIGCQLIENGEFRR